MRKRALHKHHFNIGKIRLAGTPQGDLVVVGFYDTFQHLRSSASLPTQSVKSPTNFCSEALISARGSFTCSKSTTRDPRLYFASEGSHTQNFYALKTIHRPRPGSNPRTSDPEASMITTGPPGSTQGDLQSPTSPMLKQCLWSISYLRNCLFKTEENIGYCMYKNGEIWNGEKSQRKEILR